MTDPLSDARYAYEKKFAKVFNKILVAGCYCYEPIVLNSSHACDINPNYINDLNENGYKGKAIVADVKALPYKDKEFDCVFCTETLEHLKTIEEVKTAISEIIRVGKIWFISVPGFHSKNAKTHYHTFTIDSLSKLFPTANRIFRFKCFIFATNKGADDNDILTRS